MTNDQHPVRELGRRWAAEQAADVDTLERLATNDFTLVGRWGLC